MAATELRVPPHDIKVERQILGAMMTSEDALLAALNLLEKEDFFVAHHREIFGGIVEMFAERIAVDPVSLANYLKTKEIYRETEFVEIACEPASYSAADFAAKIVKEHSVLRSIITLSASTIQEAYLPGSDPFEIAESMQISLMKPAAPLGNKQPKKIDELMHETLEALEK